MEHLVAIVDSNFKGSVNFPEFIVILDFMRRVDDDPSLLHGLRESYRTVKERNIGAILAEFKEDLGVFALGPAQLPDTPAEAAELIRECERLQANHEQLRADVDAALLRLAQPDATNLEFALGAMGFNNGGNAGQGGGDGSSGGGPNGKAKGRGEVDLLSGLPPAWSREEEAAAAYKAVASTLLLRAQLIGLVNLHSELQDLEKQRAEAVELRCQVLSQRIGRLASSSGSPQPSQQLQLLSPMRQEGDDTVKMNGSLFSAAPAPAPAPATGPSMWGAKSGKVYPESGGDMRLDDLRISDDSSSPERHSP